MRFWMSITVHGLSLNFSCLMLVLPKVVAHGSHWIVSVVSKFWTLPTTSKRWLFYAMLSGPVVIKMMQQSQLLGWKSGSQHFPIFSKQNMWTSRPDLQFLCADCAEMGILGEERYDFCVDKVGIWESTAWLLVKDIGYLMVYLICRSQFLFCLDASLTTLKKTEMHLEVSFENHWVDILNQLLTWVHSTGGCHWFSLRIQLVIYVGAGLRNDSWDTSRTESRQKWDITKTMDYNGWSQI